MVQNPDAEAARRAFTEFHRARLIYHDDGLHGLGLHDPDYETAEGRRAKLLETYREYRRHFPPSVFMPEDPESPVHGGPPLLRSSSGAKRRPSGLKRRS